MTETLTRPDVVPDDDDSQFDTGELEATYDAEGTPDDASIESVDDSRDLSPTGSLLLRAANRVNGLLEQRAMTGAHSEALKEYRDRDEPGYIDHIASLVDSTEVTPMARASAQMALESEHRNADREMAVEKAKDTVRGFGRSALTRLKNAGLITVGLGVIAGEAGIRGAKNGYEATKSGASNAADKAGEGIMTGFSKVETGMDKTGEALNKGAAKVKENYQTYQFNRETKSNERQFQKEYAKETNAFDKNAAKETKVQAKQDKKDLKVAAREDKRFESSMRKKAAQERRAERRARWSSNFNALKSTAISGVESAKASYDTGKDTASQLSERAKQKARITRTAGRMALSTYRDTKQAFKNN